MGKMKEKFLDEQQQANFDLQDRMIDDDYCCGQECGCHEENEANKSAAEYDAWWKSLTNDQKEELFKDRDDSEKEMLDQMLDIDFFGPNKTAGV